MEYAFYLSTLSCPDTCACVLRCRRCSALVFGFCAAVMYLAALPEGAYILWTLRLRQQRGCSRLPRLAPARSPIHSLDYLTSYSLPHYCTVSLSPLSLTTPSLTAPFLPSSLPHCFPLSHTLNNHLTFSSNPPYPHHWLPLSLTQQPPHSLTTPSLHSLAQ